MRLGRLTVSGGALLMLTLLYYFDDNGIFFWVLLCCALHEFAHWGAAELLGSRVRELSLTCAGAELKLSAIRPLSPRKMLLTALAGPGINLLLAAGSAALARRGAGERLYFFAGLNFGLALFNLLPVGWLDGGRSLYALFAVFRLEELGRTAVKALSFLVTIALLLAGGVLLWGSGGRNFTLLIAGLWMARMAQTAQRDIF